MSDYTHFLTLALPAPLTEVAKRISRAMDPDSGGFDGFQPTAKGIARSPDAEGNPRPQITTIDADYVVYGTPCTAEFAAQVQALRSSAAMLQGAVAMDYAVRWPEETVPTFADCEAFLGDLRMSSLWGVQAACDDIGLALVEEAA